MSEIWTAVREEPSKHDDDPFIIFNVLDEGTNETHEEQLYKSALPLMMELGSISPVMAFALMLHPYPWRFRKAGDFIYVDDDPSVGVGDYHPIDQEATQ